MRASPWLLALLAVALVPRPVAATVRFQNEGNLMGWDRLFTQHAGTNTQIDGPTYQGPTAISNNQTYQGSGSGNYHSEIETYRTQKAGEDIYYGQAIYLPKEWMFHDQNVTFQQWAPDNNSGPWILMFVLGDHLMIGRHGIGRTDVTPITDLRGSWIRVVTRIKMATDGLFEVWVNGKKALSLTGDFMPGGPTIRWSTGIYCTAWDTDPPHGLPVQSILHDHYRVATTYEEAEPAGWDEGGSPPRADASPTEPTQPPDAGDADATAEPDAAAPAPVAPTSPSAAPPAAGGAPRPAGSSGCSIGGGPRSVAPALIAVLAGVLIGRHRRRRPPTET